MNLPKLAIANKQFTLIIVMLLTLVGIVSYLLMPRSEDPQFEIPITLIEVIYPGASPLDMESLVINPLEKELADIENIKKIESQIKNGGARITVEFLYGVDAEASYNKIKQAITSVRDRLPAGIQELLVLKATPTRVAIVQFALSSDPHDYKLIEFHAKQLEKRLEALNGVKQADIWGYPQQIVSVNVNLTALQHYNLSLAQIGQALKGRLENITPGFVDASTRRFNLRASGAVEELSQIESTIVRSDGQSVLRVKDVATVQFDNRQPTYLAYYQNKPVIYVTAQQREKTNIFSVTNAIEGEIAAFEQSLPPSVKLDTLFLQSESVEKRVDGFFANLWQGLVVVGVMSLLFLGVREAFVVIAAIPMSFLIAIGWLDFSGFGLQQMSIVGLIIALGLLVDNAIVVTESIHREKKSNSNIQQAAAQGASKVGWAISSGTATTMLAFLPMLLIASTTGDFVRSMPVTVVLVLLASLLIALTLTPLLASLLLSNKPAKVQALQHYVNLFAEKLYAPALMKLLQWKSLVIAICVAALIGAFSLFGQVGVSLFPKAEKPMLLVDVETPANSSLEHTESVMLSVAQQAEKYPLINNVAINVGNSNPRIYYNEIPRRGVAHFGQMLLILEQYDDQEVSKLVEQLRAEFSMRQDAKVSVKEFRQGPVTDQPITFRLMSESLTDLEMVANDLAQKMSSMTGVINIRNPIGEPNTELKLVIDYQQAGLFKIDVSQLDLTLQTMLSGAPVGQLIESNGEAYAVLVKQHRLDVERLNTVQIQNTEGEYIPLSQFARYELVKGHSDFAHFQKLRMAKVSADVASGYSINELTTNLVQYLEQYDLPKGMYYVLGGEEENRQQSFAGLSQIMMITAVGIFATLVLQFKSLLQPLIIFTSIPFAIAGAIIGLYVSGLSFSMMAFIGLISLFGIVVNNAIILIDTVNRLMADGSSKREAIFSASAVRFTPILLTTLTTIGGLLPLTLFGGNLWQPLGVVIIAGLCVSAVMSFILVPMLIEIFTRRTSTSRS